MATITYYESDFENDWAHNFVRGQSVVSKTATTFTYKAEGGFTVTLMGTGFQYGAGSLAAGGTVTKISISHDGQAILGVTALAHDLQQLVGLAMGYQQEGDDIRNPDEGAFWRAVLRGNDTFIGSSGDNNLFSESGTGNDVIKGGAGDDYVLGDAGNDALDGGADSDELSYHYSYSDANAFRGIVLDATKGTVTDSWGGHDTFKNFENYGDSAFSDVFKGSAAGETFSISRGRDMIDGGAGWDDVYYWDATSLGGQAGINANLATGKIVDPWGTIDTVKNIEKVTGTVKADVFVGDGKDNAFRGYGGIDKFDGGGGFDTLEMGNIEGRGAKNGATIDLALASKQVINDGFGNAETLVSIESIEGSNLADKISGSGKEDFIYADDGADTISGRGGNDDLGGNDGNDKIDGGANDDELDGGNGNDTLTGGVGKDHFDFRDYGSDNADIIKDFASGMDQIWLKDNFGDIKTGQLTEIAFKSGAGLTAATDTDDRIVYNTANGKLYYDHDGKGGDAADLITQLFGHPMLKFSDIFIDL